MKKAWILAAVGLLTVVFALGAVACSDDDDDGGDSTPSATDSSGDATEPSGEATEPEDGETPDTSGAFTTLVVTDNPTVGAIITTFDGYTLYTFDNDSDGTSACGADCIGTWPPMPAQGEPTGGEGVTGTLGTITRDDGSIQITYDGMPLYMYSGDPSPGDANGDGVGGVWHVVPAD